MLKKWGRYIVCGALVAVIFLVYIGRLGQWQLLEGATYAEEAVVSSSFIKLTGARGEIRPRVVLQPAPERREAGGKVAAVHGGDVFGREGAQRARVVPVVEVAAPLG